MGHFLISLKKRFNVYPGTSRMVITKVPIFRRHEITFFTFHLNI